MSPPLDPEIIVEKTNFVDCRTSVTIQERTRIGGRVCCHLVMIFSIRTFVQFQ